MSPRRRQVLLVIVLLVLGAAAVVQRVVLSRHAQFLTTASRDELEAATKTSPDDDQVWQQLAQRLLDENRIDDATAAAKRALELAPSRDENVVVSLRVQALNDGSPAAQTALERYQKDHPGSPILEAEVERLAGDRALEGGLFGEAAAHFKNALAKRPNDTPAQLGLAQAQLLLNQLPEAAALAEAVIKRTPSHPLALLFAGEAHLAKEPALAQKHLEAAEAQQDKLPASVRYRPADLLARACLAQNDRTGSERYLTLACQRNPHSAELLYRRIQLLQQTGKQAEATALLPRYQKLRDYQLQVRQLKNQLADHPDDPAPRLALARLQAKEGEFPEALQNYKRLLEKGLAVETARTESTAVLERWQKETANAPR